MLGKNIINSPWVFSLGMFAMMIPGMAFSTYYMYFYVDHLGLPIGLATLARTIYLIWDAVNGPLFGYFSDKTRTRIGRRRPWLFVAAPIKMVMFVALFSAPQTLSDTGLFTWFLVTLILYDTLSGILWVNYHALFPELYRGDKERAKVSAIQNGMQIVAVLIGTAVTPLIFAHFGYMRMALLFGAIFLLIMWTMVFLVRETSLSQPEALPFIAAFRTTLGNGPFWILNIANSFAQTVNGLLSAGIPFYAKYVLGISDQQMPLFLASVFLSVVPMVAVWYVLIKRLGSVRAWRLAFAMYGLSVLPLLFVQNLAQGMLAGVVVGFGMSGFLVTPGVVGARIIDLDALKTGRRREGVYMSVAGFIQRSSGFLSAVAFYVAGRLYGYESGTHPGPQADAAFRFLMGGVPLLLLVVSFVVSLVFRLPEAPPSGVSEDVETAES
ncbi:MAG: putative sugar transporter [Candidatus Carbobacillus altaicus]|uniref:Putative sugar transporter n=1 Tax=Candidatus Carbonibacillus altaicus TaxID=2163959 RepID=A0A2R6XYI9_9BACL|nr:MAG: putative sugar transporter [Candidatus Carbobacillus altaicus]